ncbi:serine/threonine-protein kinase ATM-like [Pyrus ussuriensis x Pyrus communis]|uniref:Serine/threonine-protein kinase ATM-like n=1 Tax=Pyrus ussuriensis x Pyrus communis TaxID=2448454 RepID=A0A5N5G7G1_9ROSA|nr:serine/threonine-protein kinase ATM-like [Pyrus ussuriensis x Pyrus communis]
MVTSRDVQEIVSKPSSDKVKTQEVVVYAIAFLLPNTAVLLCFEEIVCASLEISSSSKRRLPKLIYAKTLLIVVQQAEDDKFSGKRLPLLAVVKNLFNHICEVLHNDNVPSFQSECGIILRHLLAVRDYRFQMKRHTYCSLVQKYMEKVDENSS